MQRGQLFCNFCSYISLGVKKFIAFAGAVVQGFFHLFGLLLRDSPKLLFLGVILPDESVEVFIRSSFTTAVGPRKIVFAAQSLCYFLV